MRQPNSRYFIHSQKLGCLVAAVTGNDLAVIRNEHGIVEPELLDRRRYVLDLPTRMRPRIAAIGSTPTVATFDIFSPQLQAI